ncbi:MAG TPA: hypothetical protein VM262_20705 [Acidimicrobiales bacterium]|nr:hypothetical protein [Acidimicrobiales bacterium]
MAVTAEKPDAAVPGGSRAAELRDEAAYMVCGLWMVIGLYIDGWSHQADKPETFFTPWHAVLYSGFGAAVVYSGWIAARDARAGRQPAVGDDRITTLGVVLFALGAGGDLLWHTLVGIEVDIEGLISPTHVALMAGGLLMVTLPVRGALRADHREAPVPVVASIVLAIGVAAFFLMYLMPWNEAETFAHPYVPDVELSNRTVETGMATVIVTTALFFTAILWTARRWRLPAGAATVGFTLVALGQSGLSGFDVRLPILAATAAGLVTDVLLRRGRSLAVVGLVGGTVLWVAFFALFHAETGVEWGPSLWVGAVVFGGLSGLASGVAVRER